MSTAFAQLIEPDWIVSRPNPLSTPGVDTSSPLSTTGLDMPNPLSTTLSRAQAVEMIVDRFDLNGTHKSLIDNCMLSPDECFFSFAAMSDYDGIKFDPLQLYPDVNPDTYGYDAINTASILDLVHGYLDESQSPFHPERAISRIESLKVVLGAANLLQWKEKFELEGLIDLSKGDRWWYDRYLNFAKENGIIETIDYSYVEQQITRGELEEMIKNTLAVPGQKT